MCQIFQHSCRFQVQFCRGGQLLEFFGVSAILIAGILIAAMGTLVILLTVEKRDRVPV